MTNPAFEELYEKCCVKIRRLMYEDELTQRELSDFIGMNENKFSCKINNKFKFSTYELLLIARELDVTLDELFCGE